VVQLHEDSDSARGISVLQSLLYFLKSFWEQMLLRYVLLITPTVFSPWHFSLPFHMSCSCLKEHYKFSLLPELCLSNAVWGDRLQFPEDNLNISLIIPDVDTTVAYPR